MKLLKNIIGKYADFISRFPWLIITLVLILLVAAFISSQTIRMVDMDNSNMLPDDIPVMWAFNVIGDSFGGDNSVKIAIEVNPQYISSGEPRDIRDFDVMNYVNLLEHSAEHLEDVTEASSAATVLRDLNDGRLPQSQRKILELTKDNALFDPYISRDFEMTIITIYLTEDYSNAEIVAALRHLIDSVPRPAGLLVNPAGEAVQDVVVQEVMGSDMGKTSFYSLLGILLVLILLFRSIKYSFTPLATIAVGVVWAFGYIGLRGINMTSATSGVASMIMGIGIDFGIQTITRFRQELKSHQKEKALKITMQNVFGPMATTTLAALIGFSAMGMGTLSMMGDMADMMAYGIAACFLAAITIVPALLIVAERISDHYARFFGKSNKQEKPKKEPKEKSKLKKRKKK